MQLPLANVGRHICLLLILCATCRALVANNIQFQVNNAEKCRLACRCEVQRFPGDNDDERESEINRIQQLQMMEGSGWQQQQQEDDDTNKNGWQLKMNCQPLSSYQTTTDNDTYNYSDYPGSRRAEKPLLPEIDIRSLEVIHDASVLEPINRLCDRYPHLSRLSINKADFARIREFSRADCLKVLHLQTVKFRNLDWLEYTSTSLMTLTELWLGGNTMEEGRLRGYTFSLLHDLTELRLNATGIFELDDEVFFNLNKLKRLDLSDNYLSTVPRRALATLVELETLNLNGNWIVRLSPFDLNDFMNLKHFYLAKQNGQLLTIDRESFGVLPALKTLILENNPKLAYIHPEAFLFCPELNTFDIRRTAISTIDEVMIGSLPLLNDFNLDDNRLRCDCQIKWIINSTTIDNLEARVREDIKRLRCAKPSKYRGRYLIDVIDGEPYMCQPNIPETFESSIVINRQDRVSLHCRADGKPRTELSWKLPTGEVIANSAEAKVRGLRMNDLGSLILNEKSPEGMYTCKASSLYGADTKSCFVINSNARMKSSTKSTLEYQRPTENRRTSIDYVLAAPIITSVRRHKDYISIEWKLTNDEQLLLLPDYITTVKILDQNDNAVSNEIVSAKNPNRLFQKQPKYDVKLPKLKNFHKICVQTSCCRPTRSNQTCASIQHTPTDNGGGYISQIDNMKKRGSVVVALCLCLSIVLLASGVGACSNSTFKREWWFPRSKYTKLHEKDDLADKIRLHEISAPLINEAVSARNKTNLMINTSSSFTYSC